MVARSRKEVDREIREMDRTLKKVARTPKAAKAFLVKHGFATKSGTIAKRYR